MEFILRGRKTSDIGHLYYHGFNNESIRRIEKRRMILDKNDLTILPTLARDCRTSYSSIGSQIGLTAKSVKARVKKMIGTGVIEKFVVRVNPLAFGYRTAFVLIRTSGRITKDEVIERVKEFGDLAYHVHHMGSTSMAALIIKKPLDDNTIQSLNNRLKPATVLRISVAELSVTGSTELSETDLRIIKCLLLSGARTEISNIAKEVGISEKTTTRRLTRMKESRLLDFSLQCSPAAMIGYIQFVIPIIVAKSHYDVLERMYSEFQASILYSPSIIQPENQLTFVLYGENVFMVDDILIKVNSFAGVNSADAYILTKWQYYDDWIMKEINKRLLLRPMLQRSR
jgi:DNA-binding Lrp family transcriptional regulator